MRASAIVSDTTFHWLWCSLTLFQKVNI